MITIHVSTRFKRSYKKLPKHVKEDFSERIKVFRENPFSPELKTHKLKGTLSSHYSFYLCDGFRILFDFVENNIALLINVGAHDDYKKWG
jgi:mRNA-degrading endonuclease YafQ of YafQ-DinJ toxin-antitoxin module